MSRVLVLAEGQTEETFIRNVLAPHLAEMDVFLDAKIATTKRVKSGPHFKGGIVSYQKMRDDIVRLLGDTSVVAVTTLIDFYGLPFSVPGVKTQPLHRSCFERVDHVEKEIKRDINHKKFIPYLALHEFEAMLLVSPEIVATTAEEEGIRRTEALEQLTDVRQAFDSPEEIDDDPATAPSKRITTAIPSYRKPLHGPLISERIGLAAIRAECRHFADWLKWLEGLD